MPSKKKRKAANKKINSNEIFQVIKKSSMGLKFKNFVADNRELLLNATIETGKHTTPLSPLSYALYIQNFDYAATLIDLGFPIEKQLLKEKGNKIIEDDDTLIHRLLNKNNDKINQALLERFKATPNILIDEIPLLSWGIDTFNKTFSLMLLDHPEIDTFTQRTKKIHEYLFTPLVEILYQIAISTHPEKFLPSYLPQEFFLHLKAKFSMQKGIEKKIQDVRNRQGKEDISEIELQMLLTRILKDCDANVFSVFEEITKTYSTTLSSLDFSINNQTPLHTALSSGNVDNCVQWIKMVPSSIYSLSDLSKETALQVAALYKNERLISFLIDKHNAFCSQEEKPPGFIEDYVNYTSRSALPTALCVAVTQPNNLDVVKALVTEGASLKLGDFKHQSPLQIALMSEFFNYIPFLATKDTVNLASEDNLPLHQLFSKISSQPEKKQALLKILDFFLQRGADPTLPLAFPDIKQVTFEKKPEGIIFEHLGIYMWKYTPKKEDKKEQNIFEIFEETIFPTPKEMKSEREKEIHEDKMMLEHTFQKLLFPLTQKEITKRTTALFSYIKFTSPLLLAITYNLKDVIKHCHQHKINLNSRLYPNEIEEKESILKEIKSLFSITPLLLSIIHQHDDLTELLINLGCDPKLGFLHSELTPFLTTIIMGNNERVIKLLCEKSDPKQQQIEKAICLAAYMNNVVIVKFLLETAKKYSLNLNDTENTHGLTALSCAAFQDSTECVRLLLENNASPNVPVGPRQETPLFQAVKNNNPEMIADLIDHDAKTDCYNKHGLTPLHYAIIFGNLKALKALLPRCSINVPTKFENSLNGIRDFSPLQFAIFLGRTRIADTLIKNGANVNYQTSTGETALDLTNKYRIGYTVIEKLKRKHDQTQASEKTEEDDHADDIFSNNNLSSPPQEKITGRQYLIQMGFSKSEIEELQQSFEEEDEIKTEDEDKSVEENETSWEYMGSILTSTSKGVKKIERIDYRRFFFLDEKKLRDQGCPEDVLEKFSNLRAKQSGEKGADGVCFFKDKTKPKKKGKKIIHSDFFYKGKELPVAGELKIFDQHGKGADRALCVSIPPKEEDGAPLTAAIKYSPKGLH